MRALVFLLLALSLLVPVNPFVGAESKGPGVIDFGRIDVPFKANFTISVTLSASKMYIRTDSPRIIAPPQISGQAGETVKVNVSLVVPANAKPRDYVLHIYITPGPTGSVEAQVAYQIRFTVKGIDVASFNPRPERIYLAIYNSYPESAYIRAKLYVDGNLIRELEKEAKAKGYAVRNVTGDFEGRHNITVIARSNKGYETRFVYLGEVLPVDVKAEVSIRTNHKGVEVSVKIRNLGRDINVVVEARGRSDKANDSWAQTVTLKHGDEVTVSFTLHLSLPAFISVRVIAVTVFQRNFWVRSQEAPEYYSVAEKALIYLPIAAAILLLARAIRRPRGKFKTERIIVEGIHGPILALREGEPIYPPGQALALLDLPKVSGEAVILKDKVYAVRGIETLKVYVVGYGDLLPALEKVRKAFNMVAKRGLDIASEIPPEDPIVEELAELFRRE